MSDNGESKKTTPPYVAYKTFINFTESLKIAIPNRIDRSLMRSFSGAVQSQLMVALEYLGLVKPESGVPTERLTKFVHSSGDERKQALREILISSYDFLFKDKMDLSRATAHELQERFNQSGTTGDTTRKCIAFFMKAAEDAGMELSPHIGKMRTTKSSPARNRRKSAQQQGKPPAQDDRNDYTPPDQPGEIAWQKLLLAKFPSFDPQWSPEVQKKWFEAFGELMSQFKNNA